MPEFQFGPWLPDVADFRNPALEVCKNVIPTRRGYKPAYQEQDTGDSVTGAVIGAATFERADAASVTVVATTTDFFHIVAGVVTASSLSLSLSASDVCVFEQFGVQIYASIYGDDTYVLDDIQADTSFAAGAGSPPSAKAMGRVGEFLIMGNLTDIDASEAPYRLRWSQFNNPGGTWGTDIATQSGAVDMDPQLGVIQAISSGDVGFIFQKRGISRITYTGSASVFALVDYERERGCIAPQSVIRVGGVAYFLGSDAFFSTDGSGVNPISNGRIWDWMQDHVDFELIENVRGAADWENRCVVWIVPLIAGGVAQIWYSWDVDRFSYVESDLEFIVASPRASTSLDNLDTEFPNLDAMDISLDHPRFRATARAVLGIQGTDLKAMTGPSREVTLAVGEMQPIPGRRSFISEITPLITGDAGITARVKGRNTMQEAVSESADAIIGPLGFMPVNVDYRYHSYQFTIPAGTVWDDAYGFQIEATDSGT